MAKKAAKTKPASNSKLPPGKSATRVGKRFIVVYGGPKVGKTTACSKLHAKWIIADPNAIPLLEAIDKLPAPDDTYEVGSVPEVRTLCATWLDILEKDPTAFGDVEAVVCDSGTQLAEWLQNDIAHATNQRFMGDNKKDGGHQQFNAEFSMLIDDLGALSRYVHVIVIVHAQPKPAFEKGQWAGFSLPGNKVGEKLGRTASWVLYQTMRTFVAEEKDPKDDAFTTYKRDHTKTWIGTEVVINTRTVGAWFASVNATKLADEEPADLATILEKEGLI